MEQPWRNVYIIPLIFLKFGVTNEGYHCHVGPDREDKLVSTGCVTATPTCLLSAFSFIYGFLYT